MTNEAHDRGYSAFRWKFDGEVTRVFDDMLARSIPDYEGMRDTVFRMGKRFVQPKTDVVDLGCSRGEAMSRFIDAFGAHNRFVGIEVSDPMREAAINRFRGYIDANVVDIRNVDLRREYPPVNASLTLSVLTLQFVPIEHRLRIASDVKKNTIPGGAFVLVEKVLGSTSDVDSALVDEYLDMKRRNGYSDEQIERKRLALEGVLVPVTSRWNEEILRSAGFRDVECFWRRLNFAAWIAVR